MGHRWRRNVPFKKKKKNSVDKTKALSKKSSKYTFRWRKSSANIYGFNSILSAVRQKSDTHAQQLRENVSTHSFCYTLSSMKQHLVTNHF